MRLLCTARAIADLIEISDYLVSRSPTGAKRVRAAILVTLQTIIELRRAGRLQTTDAVRKIAVRRYPHLIYYRIDEDADQVAVPTVQHSARRQSFGDA